MHSSYFNFYKSVGIDFYSL